MTGRADFYRGEIAEGYEAKRAGSKTWEREDQILDAVLGDLSALDHATVLDIPVGTGRFIPFYEDHHLRWIGLDASEEMLSQSKARSSQGSALVRGDITRIPFRSGSIDAVVCIRFSHLVGRGVLRASLEELRRVIRPGGRLVIGARLESWKRSQDGNRLTMYLKRRKRVLDFRRGKQNSRPHSERWIRRALRRDGFRLTEEHAVTHHPDESYYSILVLTAVTSDESGRPRTFELFGLPGAGKTTIGRNMISLSEGAVADGFAAIEPLTLYQCVRNSPLRSGMLLLKLLPRAFELRHLAVRQVVVNALRQICARDGLETTAVFEEGVAHEIWRQLIRGNRMSDSLIRTLLPSADVTVFVEAPRELLAERLGSKPSPGPISRSLRDESIDGPTWERGEAAYARIKEALRSRGAITATISNEGAVQDGLERLSEVVNERARTR